VVPRLAAGRYAGGQSRPAVPAGRSIQSLDTMAEIDLARVAGCLVVPRTSDVAVRLEAPTHTNGALHLSVDGPRCVTSICVWPSGAGEAACSADSGPTVIQQFEVTESSVQDVLLALANEAVARASQMASNNSFKVTPDGAPQFNR
jgi:hypothetical protein